MHKKGALQITMHYIRTCNWLQLQLQLPKVCKGMEPTTFKKNLEMFLKVKSGLKFSLKP